MLNICSKHNQGSPLYTAARMSSGIAVRQQECCWPCLLNAWMVDSKKSQATAVRVGREGQRFLLKDLHSRRHGFSSKNFVFFGQDNNSALLLRKDVRSTMSGLKPLNPFTTAMLPKNRFALYILSFSHFITTLVHAMRLTVVNVWMLNGKYAELWTAASLVIDRTHHFVAQCDGAEHHLTLWWMLGASERQKTTIY